MAMPRRADPIKHCRHCGEQLKRKRFSSGALESGRDFDRRHYCDQTCMGLGERTLAMRICPYCGKSFRPTNSASQYCGMQCNRAASASQNPAVAAIAVSRKRARKLLPVEQCEVCGATE